MPTDQTIVRAAIYPPIGIARVGNSKEPGDKCFFFGPEVPNEPALPQGEYKDAKGALRKQAARFRIYGYNAAGEVVGEINAKTTKATIEWTVHLANKKAAWYNFELALDIPEASAPSAPVVARRNGVIQGDDRKKLVIDPGVRSIKGCNTSGVNFDGGKFFDLDVNLGELRTDADGNLIVLGGYGVSQSISGQPPMTFANNDGWHDDTGDGPVDAKLTMDGREIPVDGAWAVVAPPNYAPAIHTARTMYDLMYDRMIAWGFAKAPATISFQTHIRPILERLSGLQWVNGGFSSIFGAGAPFEFSTFMLRLADASDGNREFRDRIMQQFRNPAPNGQHLGKQLWPPFYGDALDSLTTPNAQNPDPSLSVPTGLASLSPTQLGWLARWAEGNFTSDYDPNEKSRTKLSEYSDEEQPHALTEAALSYCLADAFHPGCELTWPMRIRSLYSSAYRILRRPALPPETDYGPVLTPAVAVSPIGPLNGASAGDLTKWMAVPWQTDTASCLSGYSFFSTSKTLPTFWPARVPNQVFREKDYQLVMDSSADQQARLDAFYRREDWFRIFGANGQSDIEQMITEFDKLGIIEERSGPTDLPIVPGKLWVESKPGLIDPLDAPKLKAAGEPEPTRAPARYKLRKLGHYGA